MDAPSRCVCDPSLLFTYSDFQVSCRKCYRNLNRMTLWSARSQFHVVNIRVYDYAIFLFSVYVTEWPWSILETSSRVTRLCTKKIITKFLLIRRNVSSGFYALQITDGNPYSEEIGVEFGSTHVTIFWKILWKKVHLRAFTEVIFDTKNVHIRDIFDTKNVHICDVDIDDRRAC